MNNRSVWRAVALAVLVLAGAAVIAVGAYNAGMAAGTPYVYVWPRPWGFGFFPIFPIFFLLFFFFVVRGLLWRGPWRGGRGPGHGGVPPRFDEWHRRAHEEMDRQPAGR